MKRFLSIFGSIILACIIIFTIWATVIPSGVRTIETWKTNIQRAKDDTNYKTKKEVEDTCRAMISSYNADKLMYEQYKDSENQEQRNWAESAKIRANRTAVNYNEYILKNKYVWENNIPEDIKLELKYLT